MLKLAGNEGFKAAGRIENPAGCLKMNEKQ